MIPQVANHPIAVPIGANLILLDHGAYSGGYWVRDDVYNWLLEYVGPGAQSGGWREDCEWIWSYHYRAGPQDNAILFRDSAKAMLFKLTWA